MVQFDICDAVISDNDRCTVILKKLATTVHSSLVSNRRKCATYADMKAELESEIIFLSDYGPDMHKTCHAHVAAEQPPEDEDQQNGSAAGDDEEGVPKVDLAGLLAEQAEHILLAARPAGLRFRAPIKRAPGGRFQPRPKAKFSPRVPPLALASRSVPLVAALMARGSAQMQNSQRRSASASTVARRGKGQHMARNPTGANSKAAARPCLLARNIFSELSP